MVIRPEFAIFGISPFPVTGQHATDVLQGRFEVVAEDVGVVLDAFGGRGGRWGCKIMKNNRAFNPVNLV